MSKHLTAGGLIVLCFLLFLVVSPKMDTSSKSSPTTAPKTPHHSKTTNNNNNNNNNNAGDGGVHNPPPKKQTSSTTNAISSSSPLTGKCVTYEERYAQCASLYKLPVEMRKKFFENNFLCAPRRNSQHAGNSRRGSHHDDGDEKIVSNKTFTKEVALLRMHRKSWPTDFWLFVCSFIIEASAECKRDVFLYTLDGHESSIPPEFQSFVRVHLETELHMIFRGSYTGGYSRGDLAAALFMRIHPQYEFCWLFESDTRHSGSWNDLFTNSRRAAKGSRDFVPTVPNEGRDRIGEDAHLIWWYPRMLNYGYDIKPHVGSNIRSYYAVENQTWRDAVRDAPIPSDHERGINNFHIHTKRRSMKGSWKRILENKLWCSAFVPAFGFSRTLAMIVYNASAWGDGNDNQEVNLPVNAQLHNLKIVSLAGNKEFPSSFYWAKAQTALLYSTWMEGRTITAETVKWRALHTRQFIGGTCLRETLFHPVKI